MRFIHNRVRGAELEAAALEPFEIIRTPLAQRSERIFPDERPGWGGPGTTYEAYEISLARGKLIPGRRDGAGYAIVMQNGAGLSILSLPTFYDNGAMMAVLLGMPDAILYATLYTIWRTADEAATEARDATATRYARAIVEKRTKVKRRGGKAYVEILPMYEASASYPGMPPTPVPGRFRDAETAHAEARRLHPHAASFTASPVE